MGRPDDILFSLFREELEPPKLTGEREKTLLTEVEKRFKLLLLPWLATSPSGHFLEIGCGDGKYGHFIADHVEKYTGLDIRPASIAAAQALLKSRDNCSVVAGDGRTLTGVENESMSFVFSYQSFLYMPEESIIQGYIAEIARVLGENGCARIQLPGPNLRSCLRLAWRQLASLEGVTASLFKRFLPLDTMVPALRMGEVESHWGTYGATMPAADAVRFAEECGVKAEVAPCHYGRPVNGNLSGTYWLIMYKGENAPFFLTLG